MLNIGLKLWSTNLKYIPAARDLFARKVFDYIELFTVRDSHVTISQWKELGIPYVLHAPHSTAGLNPADSNQRDANIELVRQVDKFFDALSPAFVIFHPGVNGCIKESILQFRSFGKCFPLMYQKTVIENNPLIGLRDENCLGASPEEMRLLLDSTGRGICLDFGHIICSAFFVKSSWEQMVSEFMKFKPVMFHLCDGYYSGRDTHEHLGKGQFDLAKIIKYIYSEAMLTIETKKDFPDRLDDFSQDVNFIRRLMGL